jgi:hypothetical protein
MFVYTNLNNNRPGCSGCLIFGIIGFVFVYYILKGFSSLIAWATPLLSWAAPILFVLALIISWRAVADVGKRFLRLLETNPILGLLAGALGVVGFPILSLYLFLKAIGYNKATAYSASQPAGPAEDDFVPFEELESHPKKAPSDPMAKPDIPEKMTIITPEKPPEKKPEPPKNPYEDLF